MIAIDGTGKTTFLKEILKNELEKQDAKNIYIYEGVLKTDSPFDFISKVTNALHDELHPKTHKFMGLLKKRQKPLTMAANALTLIPGVPAGIPNVINPLLSRETLLQTSEIQDNFIEALINFSRQSSGRKLIISMDDIDNTFQTELFIAMLSDIQRRLPQNVMIIVTSSTYRIDSSELISLGNFNEEQIKKFVRLNFANIDRNMINDIILKSQGYPVSLSWLWNNYNEGENIGDLLTRFSRDGFISQLQKNFFDKLFLSVSEAEQSIIKICTALELPDTLLISNLANIDIGTADRILDDLTSRGILEIISSVPLLDARISNFYSMNPVFKSAIISVYGIEKELNVKAVKFYSNQLFKVYPSPMSVLAIMLKTYSTLVGYSTSRIYAEQFFNFLDIALEEKIILNFVILQYYLNQSNRLQIENIKDFAKIMLNMSDKLENQKLKSAYKNASELIILFTAESEKMENIENSVTNKIDQIESDLSNEKPSLHKIMLLTMSRSIRGAFSSSDDESYLNVAIEAYTTSLGISSIDNAVRILSLIVMGESSLPAGGYEFSILALSRAMDEFNSLNDDDKISLSTKISQGPVKVSIIELKNNLEYDLGTAHLLRYDELLGEGEDDETLLGHIKNAEKFLYSTRSDPIKGKAYDMVKSIIYEHDLIDKGNALVNDQKFDEAVKHFENIIQSNPDNAFAWNNKGIALERMNRLDDALAAYSKAVEIDPKGVDFLGNKGSILYSLGKHDEAIEYYDKALNIDPDNFGMLNNKGTALGNLGKHDEAIEYYDKALKIDPNNVLTLGNKGLTLVTLGKYEEAIPYLDKILMIDPNDIDALGNKGYALDSLGRLDEATEYYDKVLKIDSINIGTLHNKSYLLFKLNRLEEGLQCIDKIILLDPSYANAWYNRAILLIKKGNIDEAINNLERAFELDGTLKEFVKTDEDFDSIRGNAKFRDLVE